MIDIKAAVLTAVLVVLPILFATYQDRIAEYFRGKIKPRKHD